MDGFTFPVEVIRTNRKKSISIQLDGALVKIRAPKTISDNRIRNLIAKRTPWIKTKLDEHLKRPPKITNNFVDGEHLEYLGRSYQLKVLENTTPSVKLKNGCLLVSISAAEQKKPGSIQALVEGWYKSRAEKYLHNKTMEISKLVRVKPSSVSIKNYKSRWGACSNTGVVTYNWRIIKAPRHIVEYVIIHELCHLIELNHSPRYWMNVEKFIPRWKERRDWLKSNANLL